MATPHIQNQKQSRHNCQPYNWPVGVKYYSMSTVHYVSRLFIKYLDHFTTIRGLLETINGLITYFIKYIIKDTLVPNLLHLVSRN